MCLVLKRIKFIIVLILLVQMRWECEHVGSVIEWELTYMIVLFAFVAYVYK